MTLACLMLAVPWAIMPRDEYLASMLIYGWLPAGLLLLMQLIPARHVSISMNLLHAIYVVLLGIQLLNVYILSTWVTTDS